MEKANPGMCLSAGARFATYLGSIGATHESVDAFIKNGNHPLYITLAEHFAPKPEVLFKSSDTNLEEMIKAAEKFAMERFGVTIDLRKRFVIPESLPWKEVLLVFDPGSLTNRNAVDVLKNSKLNVYEETDVINYSGSEAFTVPTLQIISLSDTPDKDTMNISPNDLRKTDKSYLRLRGYALAFALHHSMTGKYLDPKETFTWFPEDSLSDGGVADGHWDPHDCRVRFCWSYADYRGSDGGARAAILVSLRS